MQDYQNCYEYWLEKTKIHGDYHCCEHWGKKVLKSEFLGQVDRFASYAQEELHLKRGDVYTIFLPTLIHSFVAFYALNKIGVIINFIHPLMPPDQVKKLMLDVKSKGIMVFDVIVRPYIAIINEMGLPCIVCSSSDFAGPLQAAGMKIVENTAFIYTRKIKRRDSYKNAVTKYAPGKGLENNGGDVAVYLNGGGTTGESKTIKLTNFAINELVRIIGLLEIGEIRRPGKECGIVVLPLFHAYGLIINFHLPFCYAGRACSMENFNAKAFNRYIRKNDGEFVFAVGIPVMFRKLMAEKNFDGKHLRSMRLLACGGDDVAEKYLDEFNGYLEKWNAETRLRRGYGLTEVGSVCCMNTDRKHKTDSIGLPLPGLRMEIWDENRKKLPNGEIGEIVISGSTIMAGYFTVDEPEDAGLYTDDEGVKWVLSGDLGYMDDDGYFFFAGRKKRLIIISGYNVYPGDIEQLIENNLNYIKEVCAVQGFADGKPIVRLYISIIKSRVSGPEAAKKEIIGLCEKNLSKFNVPKDIVVMDELPRTPMKKIDFIALTEREPK
ncbi:MAG: acyl--CoA ligase [Oscillospiraceae bacterium]|nr:acyl--CoA ligase [Oscillospiraceae bacterium]